MKTELIEKLKVLRQHNNLFLHDKLTINEAIAELEKKPIVSAEEVSDEDIILKSLSCKRPYSKSDDETIAFNDGFIMGYKLAMHDYAGQSDAEKEQLIDFHIEVMKLGLIKEGSPKWAEHYEPFVRKVASDYYDQAFLNREEGKK